MPSERISNLIDPKLKTDSNNAVLHAQVPPAPPPLSMTNHNPYDFITNPAQYNKKKFLPGGSSQKSRIIIVAIGAVIALLLATIVFSLISSSGGGAKEDYLSLAQQQTELIRISDIGIAKAKQADAKNLATTTKYTLTSQQPAVLGFAKKSGVKTDAKTLALGKDSKTDALLTTAEQNNKFDETFTKTLYENLEQYQKTLKKIYDATSTKATKDTLLKHYKDVGNLIPA